MVLPKAAIAPMCIHDGAGPIARQNVDVGPFSLERPPRRIVEFHLVGIRRDQGIQGGTTERDQGSGDEERLSKSSAGRKQGNLLLCVPLPDMPPGGMQIVAEKMGIQTWPNSPRARIVIL